MYIPVMRRVNTRRRVEARAKERLAVCLLSCLLVGAFTTCSMMKMEPRGDRDDLRSFRGS